MKINRIIGREILDSRGNPTVEADVILEDGSLGRSAVPSGASTGSHEAHELRDNDPKRYNGMGVLKAVASINDLIAHDLVGLDVEDQEMLDQRMIQLDGTANKEHLGANAILAVSIGCIKAAALSAHMPVYRYIGGEEAQLLPLPLMNVINGGRHAVDSTDFQEFMLAPIGAESFHEALQMGLEVYHALKDILHEQKIATTVGDEGGFGIPQATNTYAIETLVRAIEKASYRPGHDISIALDAAVDELYKDGQFVLQRENKVLDSASMRAYMQDLVTKYPIFSIEDPLYEDDWAGYKQFTSDLGSVIQIVGDDLFATNPIRLQKGIDEKCANAVLVKLNQIGTLTETIKTVRMAQANHYVCIISNRSGETVDPFIADLAVGLKAGQIKTGSPARGERTAKYNQLSRIEEDLGTRADFSGFS